MVQSRDSACLLFLFVLCLLSDVLSVGYVGKLRTIPDNPKPMYVYPRKAQWLSS